MKKIYLIVALLAMTLAASAQIKDTGKRVDNIGNLRIMPAAMAYDGKNHIYTYFEDWKNDYYDILLYGSDLEKERTFSAVGIKSFYFYNLDADYVDGYGENIHISQTLFNTDEKCEYIQYTDKGAYIVQEDGNVLYSIPGGVSNVFKLNGQLYLLIDVYKPTGTEDEYIKETQVYQVDQEANNIKQMNIDLGAIRVRPAIADRDGQVTVELDGDAREIQVVNAAGQAIKRIPVGEGQRQVTFSARGLNSGVNIVRATGRKAEASRKFIVK